MRAIALLLLPPLAALACVYALGIATDAPKPATPGSTPTFVWKKQVFKNKRDFSAWLERRNVTYADWRARHPGATLPWEDDGIGGEAVGFLAAALAGLLIVLIRMRRTIGRFVVEGPLGRVIERLHADVALPRVTPMGRLSLNDAVAVFGAAAPPDAPQSGSRRSELVLVEARPKVSSVVVLDEPEPLAIAADPEPELPPEPEPEPAPALPSTLDPHRSPPAAYEEREVVCEIAFWRGYVSGQFYAHLRGDAKLSAVATSPTFRCRTDVPAETEESLAALAALTDALVGDGWEPAGSGRAWYAQRFTARVAL